MRHLSYWQHCCELSGVSVPDDKWLESRRSSCEIERQTREIANKLRVVGITPERKSDGVYSIVGIATGMSETLTAWRHINFLPSVAAGNRSQTVKRLSYFSESKPYLRYIVVTNGQRCGISDVRERCQSLSRSISRFAALLVLKDLGVTVELRVTELTAERDAFGRWSYHPHANVIINCSKLINWQSFLKLATANLPGHWHDNGRLVDPNEAVKYFVKPADVMEHRPIELMELFVATFGLRLVTPMGAFKALGLSLKTQRVKLSKKMDCDRINWEWCFVKIRDPKRFVAPPGSRSENAAMALLPPQPRFTSRFEPLVLVRNYHGDAQIMLSQNHLENLFLPSRLAFQTRSAIPFTPSPQLSEEFQVTSDRKTRNYELQPP